MAEYAGALCEDICGSGRSSREGGHLTVRRRKVLIVDDELSIVELLSAVIRHETDYQVLTALTSDSAVALARAEKPDLVLLDLILPPDDGYSVCESIKSHPETRHALVIMLTALAQESAREKSLAVGADDYLTKPFSPLALVKKLRAYLEGIPEDGL